MRRLFSILLVVTLVLSFSACASQDEPAETTGTQAATTTAATTTKSAATTTAATTTAAATTVEVE